MARPQPSRPRAGQPAGVGGRPWYVTKDLAALALAAVLGVSAIVVLTALPRPESMNKDNASRAGYSRPGPADPTVPPPVEALPSAPQTAAGVTVQPLTLDTHGWEAEVTGISAGGVAVGIVRNGLASRAVRWDAGTVARSALAGPVTDNAAEPRSVPAHRLRGSIDSPPAISADGTIAYATAIPAQEVGRPVAVVAGQVRPADRVAAGSVVGVNAAGIVLITQVDLTGGSEDRPGTMTRHGLLWNPATRAITALGDAGALITDDGSVLVAPDGTAAGAARPSQLWHDNELSPLDLPGGWRAHISDGTGYPIMVGYAIRAGGGTPTYAAWWRAGRFELLPGLGGFGARAEDVNPDGVIVGTATLKSDAPRAMRWVDGQGQDLGTLGGDGSAAHQVSDSGVVVGWAKTSKGLPHAAAWLPDGRIIDLSPTLPRGGRSFATGIRGDHIYGMQVTDPRKERTPVVWTVTGLPG